jgi:hypothetical protein
MSTELLLRPAPYQTIRDVAERMDQRATHTPGSTADLAVSLQDSDGPAIRFSPEGAHYEWPVTPAGLESVANWLGVPWTFVKGLDPDLAEALLNGLAARAGVAQVQVQHNDEGVIALYDPHVMPIEPVRYLILAGRVIDPDAPVDRAILTQREFLLDVVVPEGFDRGIGGDPAVGDITRGGLRFTQNRHKNMAPQVAPYLYRLVCTNGMELANAMPAIDARGSSTEEVLAQLELHAQTAVDRLDEYISQFYALRDTQVPNPERWLRRFGNEHGFSTRVLDRMLAMAPGLGDNPTEFDLVNLVTNQANDPSVGTGLLRDLQQSGAAAVSDHAARCDHCQHRLS